MDKVMVFSAGHVSNINKAPKNVKSNIMVDYIWPEFTRITIVSNIVAAQSDLQIIERYIKNIDNIMLDNVQAPRLSQLKSYLKITGIPYFINNTNLPCQDHWQWTLFLFFFFHFILFFLYFLFLEQLGLGFICHAVTSVTTWWHSHKTDHGT